MGNVFSMDLQVNGVAEGTLTPANTVVNSDAGSGGTTDSDCVIKKRARKSKRDTIWRGQNYQRICFFGGGETIMDWWDHKLRTHAQFAEIPFNFGYPTNHFTLVEYRQTDWSVTRNSMCFQCFTDWHKLLRADITLYEKKDSHKIVGILAVKVFIRNEWNYCDKCQVPLFKWFDGEKCGLCRNLRPIEG